MSGGAVINLKGELVGLTTMASSPAGFDAMAGYAIPMDKMGRRAVETLKEGKEIEYGLLGIRPDDHTNRVRERSRPTRRPPRDSSWSTTRSSPSTTRRSSTSIRLILAVNVYSGRRHGPAQDPPRRRDDRAHDRPGQVPGRRRSHRHQSPQAMARPARRLHQRAQLRHLRPQLARSRDCRRRRDRRSRKDLRPPPPGSRKGS